MRVTGPGSRCAAVLASVVALAVGPGVAVLTPSAAGPAAAAPVAAPAVASTPEAAPGVDGTPLLMLSDDGDVWRRSLPTALLGDDLVLVPGAVSSARFWVANTSDVPAVLGTSVALDEDDTGVDDVGADGGGPSALSPWVRLDVAPGRPVDPGAAAGGTTAGPGADAGRDSGCPAGTGPVVAAGAHVPLDVTVALDEAAPVEVAGQALAATVTVTLGGLATRDDGTGCAPTAPADRVLVPVAGSGASGPAGGAAGGSDHGGATGAAAGPGAGADAGADAAATAGGDGRRDLLGPSSTRPAGDGEPVPFVPVPLRGSWLPVTLAALAALAGGLVAAARRRRARRAAGGAGRGGATS